MIRSAVHIYMYMRACLTAAAAACCSRAICFAFLNGACTKRVYRTDCCCTSMLYRRIMWCHHHTSHRICASFDVGWRGAGRLVISLQQQSQQNSQRVFHLIICACLIDCPPHPHPHPLSHLRQHAHAHQHPHPRVPIHMNHHKNEGGRYRVSHRFFTKNMIACT